MMRILSTRCLMTSAATLALLVTSSATAQVECGEEYLDQLRFGVFTICKEAPADTEEIFDFEISAEGPSVDAGSAILVPEASLKDGECIDVFTAPSGPGLEADTVTMSELVPEGWEVDGICVLNTDEDDGISSHEYGPGTETIQGTIDANKEG